MTHVIEIGMVDQFRLGLD